MRRRPWFEKKAGTGELGAEGGTDVLLDRIRGEWRMTHAAF